MLVPLTSLTGKDAGATLDVSPHFVTGKDAGATLDVSPHFVTGKDAGATLDESPHFVTGKDAGATLDVSPSLRHWQGCRCHACSPSHPPSRVKFRAFSVEGRSA